MRFRPALMIVSLSFLLLPAAFISSCAPAGVEISPGAVKKTGCVIKDVPFYPDGSDQWGPDQCGPVSLAEVMNYYGGKNKTTPARISRRIWSKTARGTLDIDMPLYPARAGFRAVQYRGSVRDIERNIDRGRPLIVFVDYGFWVYQHGHYMVVVGYDNDGVVVHTGNTPLLRVPWDKFLGSWRKTGYWTLLITPPKSPKGFLIIRSPR